MKKKNNRRSNNRPYKSGLEKQFAKLAALAKLDFEYEADTFSYIIPSHYTPDFKISQTRFIETKGYLSPSNRARLIAFKKQYPNIEICLLFGNWDNKLNARSKTTYRQWANKVGFKCADIRDGIPKLWWNKNNKNNGNQTN